ncbi:Ribonucleotide monophosphatase NagD [Andreprevotia sp. IGB-42]|uniref:HAD-IIA family hydrolase n=1 Tax=Andreprevotia sp. IGB-42 TaxID=2497473 RepID=UPI00157E8EFA|nr:HAD-IIA family hydrolase [Andreprevotia sp. IGB-42]KAF0812159.1 Ribonucleotide monophosphatase NagD [Andreprevotia sp. IGB-42]
MIKAVISDMDGVIYRGKQVIVGAQDFVDRLRADNTPFLFLTNNAEQTPLDLKLKLAQMGIHGIEEENFITSAMATAMFLRSQKERATAFVIGGGGLMNELYNVGFSLSESHPDYVVVSKTANFNFEMLKKAVRLIDAGAKFIGTNPDMIDPVEGGNEPAAGTILAAISAATGKKPYIVGKPNSLMMMLATRKLGVHPEEALMVGDRMDTDIVGGMEAGMKTALVLSGVTTMAMIEHFPYKPDYVFNHVGEIGLDKL